MLWVLVLSHDWSAGDWYYIGREGEGGEGRGREGGRWREREGRRVREMEGEGGRVREMEGGGRERKGREVEGRDRGKEEEAGENKGGGIQKKQRNVNLYTLIKEAEEHTHSPAYGQCGVAGSIAVGLVHKHQLVAGVRETGAQELLKEPKHLLPQHREDQLYTCTCTYNVHVHGPNVLVRGPPSAELISTVQLMKVHRLKYSMENFVVLREANKLE